MQFAHLRRRPQANRRGLVLLMMLLLVIVLGVIVYFFGIYPEDRKTRRLQEQSPDQYPWVEEWRIKHLELRKPRDHEERELSDEQPHITEHTRFMAEVKQGNERLDKMYFVIRADGTAEGHWYGDFDTSTRMHYMISSNFKGNIDLSKIYSDEDRIDPSKLYFITRGKYSEVETNKVHHVRGKIYEWEAVGEKVRFDWLQLKR